MIYKYLIDTFYPYLFLLLLKKKVGSEITVMLKRFILSFFSFLQFCLSFSFSISFPIVSFPIIYSFNPSIYLPIYLLLPTYYIYIYVCIYNHLYHLSTIYACIHIFVFVKFGISSNSKKFVTISNKFCNFTKNVLYFIFSLNTCDIFYFTHN